jgi:hypothetical protein
MMTASRPALRRRQGAADGNAAVAPRIKAKDRDMPMTKPMMRLTAVSALLAATALAGGAFAGQEPYIATVCDDTGIDSAYCVETALGITTSTANCPSAFEDFYLSAKEYQFTHTNRDEAYRPVVSVPTFASGETFKASTAINQPDYCRVQPVVGPSADPACPDPATNRTARLKAKNSGVYEWTIVLPKKPEGNLNLAIQCGVFKPEETDVMFCAGEEGEIQGPGRCNQALTLPGRSNILASGLPTISARAYPGLYTRQFNNDTPFTLTAYRTPSNMTLAFTTAVPADPDNRIPLKACLTETIFIKQPVTGHVNSRGEIESDLESGDYIVVRMDVPRGHTMDLYCHAQSVKLQGIGDPLSLLD